MPDLNDVLALALIAGLWVLGTVALRRSLREARPAGVPRRPRVDLSNRPARPPVRR